MLEKDLLEENFIIGVYSLSIYPKYKVKVKEIIEKHNKEIGWKFKENIERDVNGDRLITFKLSSFNENLKDMSEKMDLFVGLIEDIYNSIVGYIDEETSVKYNTASIGIATGEEFSKSLDIEITKSDKNKNFFYREIYNKELIIIGDMNKIIELEKTYPKLVRMVFGTLVQEWYEENVDRLKKTFIGKEDFELAKAIVEKIEKSNIKKIQYNLKKFRLTFS